MSFWMEIPWDAEAPKRGDIIQTNIGTPRERTWMILRSKRRPKYGFNQNRYTVWRARWWELEPDFRMRLYRSAQRNGGQQVWYSRPLKTKKRRKKLDFEQYMKRTVLSAQEGR